MLRTVLGTSAIAGGIGTGLFAHYYEHDVCRPPDLYYHKDSLNVNLVRKCPSLTSKYEPTFWMFGAHLQTILGAFFRARPAVNLQRDIVECRDGGHLSLTWEADSYMASRDDTPILLILPGLTGSSRSKYICQLMKDASKQDLRPVVLGYRGFDVNLRTPMVTTCATVGDVEDSLMFLRKKHPDAPIYAIGFSMGANMLVKYLGSSHREGRPQIVSGAVAVSNPFDFVKLSIKLREFSNEWLYSRPLCMRVKWFINQHQENAQILAERVHPTAFAAATIYELDDRLSRHLYGIATVEEYYMLSSSLHFLEDVDCPLLLLNARDDPFLGGEIPYEMCQRNPNLMLAVTERGGHVAWTTGVLPRSWMLETTLQYLSALRCLHMVDRRHDEQEARGH
ncbi:AB hydrolase-1 domain-containing protein [Plasmodiophora brassicae]|nr:hypothetical protein PBRA_001434 [Plasmodiophora brassicae]